MCTTMVASEAQHTNMSCDLYFTKTGSNLANNIISPENKPFYDLTQHNLRSGYYPMKIMDVEMSRSDI